MVQLKELLGKKSNVEIMTFLSEKPTTEFSFTELQKRTGLAKATLAASLQLLSKNNLIQHKKIGTSKLYSLVKENTLNKQFKILINITELQPLKKIAEKHNCDIYLYGSKARGEDTEKSDIDLLVAGNVKEEIISEIRKALPDKEIRIKICTALEWSQMSKKDKAFYERVEKDKIKL